MKHDLTASLAAFTETRRDADRYARLVAVLARVLHSSPRREPMPRQAIAREFERLGVYPIAGLVLKRTVQIATAAGIAERLPDGRLRLPMEF